MAHYTGGVNTVCPFYRHESRYQVTCEGLTQGAATQLRFEEEAGKKRYMEERCARFDYERRCPLAGLLMKKYE